MIQVEALLSDAASILPAAVPFSVAGYRCISAASIIRPENICELISSGYAVNSMTKPANALIYVCEALNLNGVSFLSPHCKNVSKNLRLTLDECGLKLGFLEYFLEYLMNFVRDMLHAYLLGRL